MNAAEEAYEAYREEAARYEQVRAIRAQCANALTELHARPDDALARSTYHDLHAQLDALRTQGGAA